MNRRSFILTVAPALVLPGVLAHAQPAPWAEQAEREFGMGRGLGRQLMTEGEWQEHQQKMRTMTSEERARYREEMHERMRERATEKGIAMPDAPRSPRGSGPQPGASPGSGGRGRR